MSPAGTPKATPKSTPRKVVWTDEMAQRAKDAHAFYDKDGSGKISYKELVAALERYGVTLPR